MTVRTSQHRPSPITVRVSAPTVADDGRVATELRLRLRRLRVGARGPTVREDARLHPWLTKSVCFSADPEWGRAGLTQLAIPVDDAASWVNATERGDDVLEPHGVVGYWCADGKRRWRIKATRTG